MIDHALNVKQSGRDKIGSVKHIELEKKNEIDRPFHKNNPLLGGGHFFFRRNQRQEN